MTSLILAIVIAGLAAAVALHRVERERERARVVQSRLEWIRREGEQQLAVMAESLREEGESWFA